MSLYNVYWISFSLDQFHYEYSAKTIIRSRFLWRVSEIFPCIFGVRNPSREIVKHAYGGLPSFCWVLVSCSRILRCLCVGCLACKEYKIKVFHMVLRVGWLRKRNNWRRKNKYCQVITFWYFPAITALVSFREYWICAKRIIGKSHHYVAEPC